MNPHIIVAIDVGMTCTGVCYAVADQTSQLYMIQKWPGSAGASADKVPTIVCYRNGRFSSWGFETNQEDFSDPDIDVGEWFKVYLDRKEYRDAPDDSWPRSYEDVKRAYRDFLRQLYGCIKEELQVAVLRSVPWKDASVEFIFSVPTTWTAMAVTTIFESLLHESGFGSEGDRHQVVIGLTEAEAAAVHTFATEKEMYQDGDIILVVDAGGGTTDLCLMRGTRQPNGQMVLKELDTVRGLELGSVEIDVAFEDVMLERLQNWAHELSLSTKACERAARKMAREGFKPFKENFGSEMSDRQTMKRINILGVSDSVSIPHAGIRGGGMMISNDDIQSIFDKQMGRMTKLIDDQMDKMDQVAPYSQISYMVLSGGLGSSEYLRKRLTERYITNLSTVHRNAKDMQILRSRHPQAAPVKGLLHDRLNRQKTGQAILSERISRFSLGVICDQQYDGAIHVNQDLYTDQVDGRRYARGQIAWFIKKGDKVSEKPVNHSFYRTQQKHEPREPWQTRIVLSHRAGPPPRSTKDDGVVHLCRMTSDLTKVNLAEFEKHKKKWYQCDSLPTWYSANYEIRFVMGAAAAIDAELWFRNQKYNEPSSFKVDWEEGATVSAPREVPAAVEHNYDRFRR